MNNDSSANKGARYVTDFFLINNSNDVVVTPGGKDNSPSLSISVVAAEIETRGLSMPVLLKIKTFSVLKYTAP